jgi:hypothetical protein
MISARWLGLNATLFAALGFHTPLGADTVFLKNGAFINGVVSSKGEEAIILQVGEQGRLEIVLVDVYAIEKNSLTGAESSVPVEARERLAIRKDSAPEKKGSEGAQGNDGARPDPGTEAQDGAEGAQDGAEDAEDDEAEGAEGGAEDDGGKDEAEGTPSQEPEIDADLKKRIEELVTDLDRQKAKHRVRAERHLKAIGAPCLYYLLPLAGSESEQTRIAVMRLFDEFGDDTVIDACIEALLDANEFARDYANRALKRITLEDFGFQPSASPRRREIAHEKWVKWWQSEKRDMAEARELAR